MKRVFSLTALTCLLLSSPLSSAAEPAEVVKLRDDRQRLITLVLGLEADFSETIKDYRALQKDYHKLLAKPVIPDQRKEVTSLKKELATAANKLRELQRLEAKGKKQSSAEITKLKKTIAANLTSLQGDLTSERKALKTARVQLEELRIIQIETRKVEELLRRETIGRAELQASLQSIRGERDALLLRLEQGMTKLGKEIDGRKKAEARVAQLEKSSAVLQADLKKRDVQITALEKDAIKTKSLQKTITRLEADQKSVTADLVKERAELAKLKGDLKAKDKMIASMAALKKELGASKATLATRNTELKKAQAEFLQAELAAQAKLAATAVRLQKDKEALAKEATRNVDLLKKVQAELTAQTKLAATASQLAKDKAALAKAATQSGDMLMKVQANLAKRTAEDKKFRADAAKRLEEIFAKNEAQLAELAKEQSEQTKATNLKLAALEKDKTKLQNELAKRDTELKKAKAAAADQSKIKMAVAKIEKEKTDLSAKLAAREADLKKVRADLGKLHLTSEATEKQMQALKVRFATVDPVRYALGAADVRDQQERVLRDVKEVVAMFPSARFEIVGHTCDLGSKDGNLKLSQERASSLATFLGENGISPDLLKSRGLADAEPLVPNTSEENRRRNRRVEVHILD